MANKGLVGRCAVVLLADQGRDFGLDTVTPVGYRFGVVVSQSRDKSVARAIIDAGGERHKATDQTHFLPRGIYACGLLAAIRSGEVKGVGVASVAELRDAVKGIIHTASHRAMCARHDLRDGCECDLRGWR